MDNRRIVDHFEWRLEHRWTVGEGIEWAFAGPWSAKIEYRFISCRVTASLSDPVAPGVLPGDVFTTANRNIQTVRFGINYRFGGGEASAAVRMSIGDVPLTGAGGDTLTRPSGATRSSQLCSDLFRCQCLIRPPRG